MNEEQVVDALLRILKNSGYSVKVMYTSSCKKNAPELHLRINSSIGAEKRSGTLEQVRALFAENPSFVVTEKPDKIIEVSQFHALQKLFQVKIKTLRFNSETLYNPELSLGAAFDTPELVAAEKRLRIQSVMHAGSWPIDEGPGRKHLPPLMQNVTLDQILFTTLTTFRGVFVYGQCMGPNAEAFFDFSYSRSDEFEPQ
jgi:hypothetical protein